MKYYLLLFAVMLLIPAKGICQDNGRAELFASLKNARDDSTRSSTLLAIGYSYAGNKQDSAEHYYKAGYAIANRIHCVGCILKYYAVYEELLSLRSKKDEAIAMSLDAVAMAEHSGIKRYIGAAYNNIAGSYTDLSDMDKALAYYLKALSVYESINDNRHLAAVYVNIMGIYSSIGHSPQEALKYGFKAIDVCRKEKNYPVLEEALCNASVILSNLGRKDEAVKLLKESLTISIRLDDKSYIITALINLSQIYAARNQFGELKSTANRIGILSKEMDSKIGLGNSAYYLGICAFDEKKYADAAKYFETALALARANGINNLLESTYFMLADVGLVNGNLSQYYHNSRLADSVRDKFNSAQLLHNRQELEAKYNLTKKEAQIENLHKEEEIQKLILQRHTTYIIILFLVIIIMLIVFWMLRRGSMRKSKLLKAEKELTDQRIQSLETEKQLLSTQALMQGQEAERSRLAKDLHDGLGGILTGTKYSLSSMKENMIISAENALAFEKTMNMLDLSINELRRVAHNMMPESLLKLSLDDALADYCQQVTGSGALRVTYQSFGIENLLADEQVKISVYRVVQELINNAVKHAGAKSAIVQISLKEKILGITVEDDGKGFDPANLSFTAGMGYRNIKSRVDFLNGTIDTKSGQGKGTSIFIKLPV